MKGSVAPIRIGADAGGRDGLWQGDGHDSNIMTPSGVRSHPGKRGNIVMEPAI